jgi:hypothetical protein
MRKLTYREPHPITRKEAEAAFASADSEEITLALVSVAFHDPDWRWVQDQCLHFAQHDVANVRQVAATCLGHVARIHRQLDLEKVLPVLQELSHDPEIQVEDALDDIQMFVGCDSGGD